MTQLRPNLSLSFFYQDANTPYSVLANNPSNHLSIIIIQKIYQKILSNISSFLYVLSLLDSKNRKVTHLRPNRLIQYIIQDANTPYGVLILHDTPHEF
jgi:hypothetical protein